MAGRRYPVQRAVRVDGSRQISVEMLPVQPILAARKLAFHAQRDVCDVSSCAATRCATCRRSQS